MKSTTSKWTTPKGTSQERIQFWKSQLNEYLEDSSGPSMVEIDILGPGERDFFEKYCTDVVLWYKLEV
jgi:hypothetical protein